jgi:hypothetical protein
LFSIMKKLYSSRTEIFSNRIRTKMVMLACQGETGGWVSVSKYSRPKVPTETAEAEQRYVPPSSRKTGSLLSCRRKPLSWLAERFRFRHIPHDVDHAPQNVSWRSGTMTASRVETQRCCFSAIVRRLLSPFVVPLSIYIFAIKLGFISLYSNTNSSP